MPAGAVVLIFVSLMSKWSVGDCSAPETIRQVRLGNDPALVLCQVTVFDGSLGGTGGMGFNLLHLLGRGQLIGRPRRLMVEVQRDPRATVGGQVQRRRPHVVVNRNVSSFSVLSLSTMLPLGPTKPTCSGGWRPP